MIIDTTAVTQESSQIPDAKTPHAPVRPPCLWPSLPKPEPELQWMWSGYGLGLLETGSVRFELNVDAQRSALAGRADDQFLARATLGW